MMIALDITGLVALSDRLVEVLQHVKGKLVRHPDPALDKLAVVLLELSKIYLALEQALTDYLSLLFDPTQPLYAEANKHDRRVLIDLEGGRTEADMKAARGHCGKIENIYYRYLDRWFADILSREEGAQLYDAFHDLSEIDGKMVHFVEQIAFWLSQQALKTNMDVSQGALEKANAEIMQARKEILPFREQLSKAVGTLQVLEAEFIGVSGAIGSQDRSMRT